MKKWGYKMISKANYRASVACLGIILIISFHVAIVCEAQVPLGAGEPLGQVRRIQGPAILQRWGFAGIPTSCREEPGVSSGYVWDRSLAGSQDMVEGQPDGSGRRVSRDSFDIAVSGVPA